MSSEKSILLPVMQLGYIATIATKPDFSRAHTRRGFHWIRQYGIPVFAATALHLGAAFWPTNSEKRVAPVSSSEIGTVQMIAEPEATPAPSQPSGATPSSSVQSVDKVPSLTPPTLAEPLFELAELASSLRQELSDYAKTNMGRAGMPTLPAPTLSLDGLALSALAGNRSGGGMTFAPEPPYPRLARQEGREGVVELDVVIRHSGRVESAVVSRTSGFGDLDRAARETVIAQWQFPTGQPGQQSVRVSFRLTAADRRR